MSLAKRLRERGRGRATATTSDAIRRAVDARRLVAPLVVQGLGPRMTLRVTPEKYKLIDIDATYQRDEITSEVNQLIAVLRAGGSIPDPVTLVTRSWAKDGKLWVVDGLQRVSAHMQLDLSFDADVYEAPSLDTERALFLVMQSRVRVSSNREVKAAPYECAQMLRDAAQSAQHPLCNRVEFVWTGSAKLGAALLIRGALHAAIGGSKVGRTQQQMSRLDYAFKADPETRPRVTAYFTLAGRVFPSDYALGLSLAALGSVAYERWKGKKPTLPNAMILSRLVRVSWGSLAPTPADRFRPLVEDHVRRIWKE